MRKKIDAFVLGNSGPEVLYDLQCTVLTTLKEKYYPPFLLSSQYNQLKEVIQRDFIAESPQNEGILNGLILNTILTTKSGINIHLLILQKMLMLIYKIQHARKVMKICMKVLCV